MKLIYFLFSCLFACNESNLNSIKVTKKYENNQQMEIRTLRNKTLNVFVYDSIGRISEIRSPLNDSAFETMKFNEFGGLDSKEIYNKKGELNGVSFYFYKSGDIYSIRRFRNNLKVGVREDYYERTRNLWQRFFFDTAGVYYYAEVFSDASYNKEITFNPNNPRAYQLIKANVPEPDRSRLLFNMEMCGFKKKGL